MVFLPKFTITWVAAEFNISKYLKPGKNLIAMQVMRWCDGSYFEDQQRNLGYLYGSAEERLCGKAVDGYP